MEGKYFEEKIEDAYEAGQVAMRLKKFTQGTLTMPYLCFYHSLTALAKFDMAPKDVELLEQVRENQKFLEWWASNCRTNGWHLHPY